jgi:hypothetical protein
MSQVHALLDFRVVSSLDGEAWFCRKTSGIVVISSHLTFLYTLPSKGQSYKVMNSLPGGFIFAILLSCWEEWGEWGT